MAFGPWWLWFSRLTGPWCYRYYHQQADGQPGIHRELVLGGELCTTKNMSNHVGTSYPVLLSHWWYSVIKSYLTLCDPRECSTPGLPVLLYLPEFVQIHVHCVGHAIHPTISSSVVPFSSCLQSFPASGSVPVSWVFTLSGQSVGVSAWASALPMNIPSKGLISFRIDGVDLLAVQGTLKSLLLHHSLTASVIQHSAFFTVQLSHPYITPGKTIALTIQTFVGKVTSAF